MDEIVFFEWTYSPCNFFEEPISIKRNKYDMFIDNGKVEARIQREIYDNDPNMIKEIHHKLNNRFLGVQLVSHNNYRLSMVSIY